MDKKIAIKTGMGLGLGGLALYALSFIHPAPAEYRRMVTDMHPEPGLETFIFTDRGYREDPQTHQFYLARSSCFIFSSEGKLLQKRETVTGSSYDIAFGMSDKFFNTFAQPINYEDIDIRVRGYLPVPKDPTKEEEAR